ncbi:uncharacterized protein LOC144350869 [Saccoglossus kowalevskii]
MDTERNTRSVHELCKLFDIQRNARPNSVSSESLVIDNQCCKKEAAWINIITQNNFNTSSKLSVSKAGDVNKKSTTSVACLRDQLEQIVASDKSHDIQPTNVKQVQPERNSTPYASRSCLIPKPINRLKLHVEVAQKEVSKLATESTSLRGMKSPSPRKPFIDEGTSLNSLNDTVTEIRDPQLANEENNVTSQSQVVLPSTSSQPSNKAN